MQCLYLLAVLNQLLQSRHGSPFSGVRLWMEGNNLFQKLIQQETLQGPINVPLIIRDAVMIIGGVVNHLRNTIYFNIIQQFCVSWKTKRFSYHEMCSPAGSNRPYNRLSKYCFFLYYICFFCVCKINYSRKGGPYKFDLNQWYYKQTLRKCPAHFQ